VCGIRDAGRRLIVRFATQLRGYARRDGGFGEEDDDYYYNDKNNNNNDNCCYGYCFCHFYTYLRQ